MATKELNERDTRLAAWLQEAYTKEAELEADLTAHIALTQKAAYKDRLKKHLKETRDHKKQVQRRLKALGSAPDSGLGPVPEIAGKTLAAVKGQVGVLRAAVTEQVETHLRNAQEELREEHVEIALYSRIETFATAVGDRDTAKLAAGIRRDEQRMAKYLEAEIGRLVKELVRTEIPKDQRQKNSRSRAKPRTKGTRATKATGATKAARGTKATRTRA